MATELTNTKKYLDLQGLQHLKEQKVLVKHPTNEAADPSAVTVGTDANGHVRIGNKITPEMVGALPNTTVIGDGALTIQVNGKNILPIDPETQKTELFTANTTKNVTYNITAADLGLASGMRFAGISTTDPKGTSGATVSGYTDWRAGDVVLYKRSGETGYEEYILTTGGNAAANWELLGDASSYALKTRKIIAGDCLTDGGDLTSDVTISHAKTTASQPGILKVGCDDFGHVTFGNALSISETSAGKHTHTVTSSIAENKVVTDITPNSTKLSVSTGNDTFVKSYPGVTSKLNTTSITGVSGKTDASKVTGGTTKDIAKAGDAVRYGTANVGEAVSVGRVIANTANIGNANVGTSITITGVSGSTTASKAAAGTAKSVAKVGSAVTYGTADCDTAVSGIAKVGSEITYGNANVGTAVKATVYNENTPAYTASYANECLTFTALGSISITPAATSTQKAYVCADGTGVSITPAKASTKTLTPAADNGTITPWTFEDVTVPKAAASATTFNPATTSSNTISSFVETVSITPAVAAPTTQTIIPAVSNGQITGSYTIGSVDVPVAASATTVATGSLSANGAGAGILTGLGTAVTASALTSASLASGTTGTSVVTGVTPTKGAISGISGTTSENGEHTHGTTIE